MKKYDPEGKCSKCGCGGVEDKHCNAYVPGNEPWERMSRALGNELKSRPEHIHRTCKNCDFTWREAPLDAETDQGYGEMPEASLRHGINIGDRILISGHSGVDPSTVCVVEEILSNGRICAKPQVLIHANLKDCKVVKRATEKENES